ncbi:MAG: AMP-binding protein [Legionellales bacterium]|nr:AMP-binding protein [Legionellales bacterium]
MLYTSGSTGKPKGILHVTGGYLVYTATTFNYIFDYRENRPLVEPTSAKKGEEHTERRPGVYTRVHEKPGTEATKPFEAEVELYKRSNDIFWCTADAGWITGHSYVVYAPLCLGATTLIYESIPNYPTPARYWEIVDKHQVSILYTSPTAIRALRHDGNQWLESTHRTSLCLLGTVGEPINPDVWEWYYNEVGHQHCPIVDTWWQTETGGILISALPYTTPPKPGSANWPFFGIRPLIVNDEGQPVEAGKSGKLLITQPWPGMMKTIYGNPERFYNAYFRDFPGYYLTGDNAYCDEEGNYWILGRSDDVLKVSGHRIGTAEVENAILTCSAVAEAAVVPVPHEIKGEAIYAFVTLKLGVTPDDALKAILIAEVRKKIGAIAAPEYIQWAKSLPKTRSGKIMRRILRKIACGDLSDLGDTSTLTDASVVDKLAAQRIRL